MKLLVAFDLDDTLFDEMEFVRSAYTDIAAAACKCAEGVSQENALSALADGGFDRLVELLGGETAAREAGLDIPCMIDIYRRHQPQSLPLRQGARETLEWLAHRKDCTVALITDGRSGTQRTKIRALRLDQLFPEHNILISEETGADKTTCFPFLEIMHRNPECDRYMYVGDNTAKDFLNPGKLGWDTACMLDQGRNVHPQDPATAEAQTSLPLCPSFDRLKEEIENLLEKLRV